LAAGIRDSSITVEIKRVFVSVDKEVNRIVLNRRWDLVNSVVWRRNWQTEETYIHVGGPSSRGTELLSYLGCRYSCHPVLVNCGRNEEKFGVRVLV
jgi:hypothetical protein